MKLIKLHDFVADESGAITVDWVVLTAAVVGMGIASVGAVRDGTGALAGEIERSLSGATVGSLASLGGDQRTPQEIRDAFDPSGCAGGIEGVYEFGHASVDADIGHFDNYADVDAHIASFVNGTDASVLGAVGEFNHWGPVGMGDDELTMFAAAICVAQERGLI